MGFLVRYIGNDDIVRVYHKEDMIVCEEILVFIDWSKSEILKG
jgi:hypothetical protein